MKSEPNVMGEASDLHWCILAAPAVPAASILERPGAGWGQLTGLFLIIFYLRQSFSVVAPSWG